MSRQEAVTPAQQRMLETLQRKSEGELRRHPDSGGWVEYFEILDASCPRRLPVRLSWRTGERTWRVLERLGLVEECPEHRDLVRPAREERS